MADTTTTDSTALPVPNTASWASTAADYANEVKQEGVIDVKARSIMILGALLVCAMAFGQTDNTFYVKEFPGQNVGSKVSAAMTQCNPNAAVPCILVLDPSLATWPQGTMPALCAQCSLLDYRAGVPSTGGGSGITDGSNYSTLAAACAAAASAGLPLNVTKVWTNVPTINCSAPMIFSGGTIQPASGAFITTGPISAPLVEIFDVSNGGGVVVGKQNAGVYPQWFGGQTGNDLFDNSAALAAAQSAAIPNGLPVLITGRTWLNNGLFPLSNTTWAGTGPGAEIVAGPSTSPSSVVSFCGVYIESPSTNPCQANFVTSSYIHGINPALRGSTTLTANPSGGFSNVVPFLTWILLVEGNAPKWNTYVSYHQVTAVNGDTITLDRPTEFDFTGATGASNFGAILISPASNITFRDLRITQANKSAYAFGSGLAVHILMQRCTFKSESATYPIAYAYANDSYDFRLLNTIWLSGMFGGWDRGSWGVEDGSVAMNIGAESHEEGEGSNHLVVRNGFYANQSGTNALFAGPGFYWDIDSNHIVSALNQTPISVEGVGDRVTRNTIIGSYGGIAFGTTVFNSDLLRPHDDIVAENYVESRLSQPCLYPPYNNLEYDVTIVNNVFNCPNPVSWNGGTGAADTNTLTYFGNKEIAQAGVTPTAGIAGYTASGAASGGVLNSGELTSIPILGGFLKTMYAFPVAASHQTFNAGDVVIASPYTSNAATTFAQVYTAPGTYGTLTGVTGSTISDSNILTITAGAASVIGQRYYTVAGVSGTKRLVFQLNANQWQMDTAANATVTAAAVGYANPTYSTIPLGASLTAGVGCASGTTGYADCQESIVGGIKTVSVQIQGGYTETGAAQTWNYPTAFYYTPAMTISGGSCGTYNPSTTASTFTFPANAAMTAENCQIVLMGQ